VAAQISPRGKRRQLVGRQSPADRRHVASTCWFVHRALWHLTYAGVFERHRDLKFVITEAGPGWALATVRQMDSTTERYRMEGSSANFFGGQTAGRLPRQPSEYFASNVFLGASFMHRSEAALAEEIGVDRIMWGSDFPHVEGSYPYSREALRATFAGLPAGKVARMVSDNAASVYGFSLDDLQALADR
jgi:predicted TIM-barrel fold metal-dependent hydrolase